METVTEQLGMRQREEGESLPRFSNTEGVVGWVLPEYVLERREMALSTSKETTQWLYETLDFI